MNNKRKLKINVIKKDVLLELFFEKQKKKKKLFKTLFIDQ